jgi:hypothetical protein
MMYNPQQSLADPPKMGFNPDPNPGPTEPMPPVPPGQTNNGGFAINASVAGGAGGAGEMDDLEARLKALQGM